MIFFPDRKKTLPKPNIEPEKGPLKLERHLQNHPLLDSMNVPCELFRGISKISLFKHINATTKNPTVDPPGIVRWNPSISAERAHLSVGQMSGFSMRIEQKRLRWKTSVLIWLVPDLIQQQVFWSDTNWILSMNNKVIELVGGFNQPNWNIWVKMGSSSPNFGVKIPKIFELPPPSNPCSS